MRYQRPLALLLAALGLGQFAAVQAQTAQSLDQGWTSTDRHYFYRTPQGSRLLPYQMFLRLERANSIERFSSNANMRALGFLFETKPTTAQQPTGYVDDNPDNLPIGWVKDTTPGKPEAIGLTCAACHTRQLSYQGTSYLVDGSQSYADVERTLQDLQAALGQTLSDSLKFARYRTAMGVSSASDSVLRSDLQAAYNKIADENVSNKPPQWENNPGPGRLDAFSHIKNRLAAYVRTPQTTAAAQVDATSPVSFPFLWDAPYLDFVQWPGQVTNWGPGSLGRNVGEVLGVFAETTVQKDWLGTVTVTSTANIPNLLEIENHLLKLKSPKWPAALPSINWGMAWVGKPVFDQYCGSCHTNIDRDAERTHNFETWSIGANVVGTDTTMADNVVNDRAPQGLLAKSYESPDTLINPLDMLTTLAVKVMGSAALDHAAELTASHKQPFLPATRNTQLASGENSLHTYKARPLNGIWATSPYLHNGSVRTLYGLMKPGAERETSFCVGSTEIDPVDVGLVNSCGTGSYVFDTSKPGNSRLGHEYGTPADTRYPVLSDYLRRAVVEYMKTL